MSYKPYKIKEEEISALLFGLTEYGEEDTYFKMKLKIIVAMEDNDYMDQNLLDMHETVLKKARNTDKELFQMKKNLYTLASMLRILAHEIHKGYKRESPERDSKRFLHLVSYNKEVPDIL